MPDMANVTVKKNDGTTDQIYTKVQSSAGDRSPAVWQNLSVGSAAGHHPEFRVSSRANGTGSARRVDMTGVWKSLVTDANGKVSVADIMTFTASFGKPLGMPDVEVNEGASQLCNLMAATLTKDQVKSGYAAT